MAHSLYPPPISVDTALEVARCLPTPQVTSMALTSTLTTDHESDIYTLSPRWADWPTTQWIMDLGLPIYTWSHRQCETRANVVSSVKPATRSTDGLIQRVRYRKCLGWDCIVFHWLGLGAELAWSMIGSGCGNRMKNGGMASSCLITYLPRPRKSLSLEDPWAPPANPIKRIPS